uniref:C-type lectin lectoxin-Phi1 n=1 Tax=Philodryas olfersii TaxID=120305 RepID=LECM1_PHIOL|nr:RecName: Full=C-type lectin lectoxin-Phi1; Short=CTL; Flags: Precursor [Philodryas olfersii]ABU68500.1 Lectoxin-Phi1 [Philodryas olfersii]
MGRFIFVSLGLLVLAFSLSGIGADQHCPSGWFSHNVSCYKLINDWKTWDEAQRFCMDEQENGQLASINDVGESVKLSDEISKTWSIIDVWIGLRLSKRKSIWEWIDGSNVTQTRWEEGEPNNFLKKEFCVVLTSRSRYLKWNDKDCNRRHRFLCKF